MRKKREAEKREKEKAKREEELRRQKEELKKQQELEKQKKNIEKEKRLERIRREQEKLKELPQIKYGDFIIRKSTFKCIHNHHIEDMAAAVNVIEKDGNIKLKKINVGYCKECNVFLF